MLTLLREKEMKSRLIDDPNLSNVIKSYIPNEYITNITLLQKDEIEILNGLNHNNTFLYLKADLFSRLMTIKHPLKTLYTEFRYKVFVHLYMEKRNLFTEKDFTVLLKDKINENYIIYNEKIQYNDEKKYIIYDYNQSILPIHKDINFHIFLNKMNFKNKDCLSLNNFIKRNNLSYVTFFGPTERIDYDFLRECNSLVNVNFFGLDNLESVGHKWMFKCAILTSPNFNGLPNLKSVGNYWMSECPLLANPNFNGLTKLETVGSDWMAECKLLSPSALDFIITYKSDLDNIEKCVYIGAGFDFKPIRDFPAIKQWFFSDILDSKFKERLIEQAINNELDVIPDDNKFILKFRNNKEEQYIFSFLSITRN